MTLLALSLLVAAIDPRVQNVVAAIGEAGCPRLFPMLTESFQKGVPARGWPSWCSFVGPLTNLESRGTKDGWLEFVGESSGRKIKLAVAFDAAGKVAGLKAGRDDSLPPEELRATLDEELARVKEMFHLPALSALVLRDGKVAEVSAVGVRRLGDPTPVTAQDRWHLGSDTKAMTATLAAMLVEEKRLSWTSTPAEVFPQWRDLDPGFRKVTLEMLLSHRGGLPAQLSPPEWNQMWRAKDAVKQRSATVHALLRRPPGQPGQFLYSNFGYLVAGAMIEKVTGQSWEAALRQRLFQPLQMSSCGFGAPASPGKIDQPWAHRTTPVGLLPVLPGPQSDNPPSLGPAGTVHCDLRDWARFAQLHLDGARGRSTRLSPASFAKLHTPAPGADYAMGWNAVASERFGGAVLSHDGSNTMFFARAWMLPAKDIAFLIVTNAAGKDAENAVDRMVFYLIARHLK